VAGAAAQHAVQTPAQESGNDGEEQDFEKHVSRPVTMF
jgi:hypothetical protein